MATNADSIWMIEPSDSQCSLVPNDWGRIRLGDSQSVHRSWVLPAGIVEGHSKSFHSLSQWKELMQRCLNSSGDRRRARQVFGALKQRATEQLLSPLTDCHPYSNVTFIGFRFCLKVHSLADHMVLKNRRTMTIRWHQMCVSLFWNVPFFLLPAGL